MVPMRLKKEIRIKLIEWAGSAPKTNIKDKVIKEKNKSIYYQKVGVSRKITGEITGGKHVKH